MDVEAWVAAMRADPDNAALMMVAADWFDEQGKAGAAEWLRMMGERGTVGIEGTGYLPGRVRPGSPFDADLVCAGIYSVAIAPRSPREDGFFDRCVERVWLAEAYEAADPPTRLLWAMATFGT